MPEGVEEGDVADLGCRPVFDRVPHVLLGMPSGVAGDLLSDCHPASIGVHLDDRRQLLRDRRLLLRQDKHLLLLLVGVATQRPVVEVSSAFVRDTAVVEEDVLAVCRVALAGHLTGCSFALRGRLGDWLLEDFRRLVVDLALVKTAELLAVDHAVQSLDPLRRQVVCILLPV